jgi:hypoxanthine phosphoribosyltransferase
LNTGLKRPKILISAEDIQARVKVLGEQINRTLTDENETLLLAVADGGLIFAADLARAISKPLYFDQIAVASYEGTASTGKITLRTEPRLNMAGRTVLLVDDILDSGQTISFLVEYVKRFNPKRIITCMALDKPAGRIVEFKAEYVGFEVPDRFVIGYGMDYNGLYRNLPYIGCLD